MKSVSSLHELPAEIAGQIFLHLDSVESVLRLARVSKHFYQSYLLHGASIYQSLLPQRIPCFEDAEELCKTQHGEKESSQHPQSTVGLTTGAAHAYAQAMWTNHRIVILACEFFTEDVRPYIGWKRNVGSVSREALPILSPTEKARFIHTYYRLWTLATCSAEARDASLEAATLRELLHLLELQGKWLQFGVDHERKRLLKLDLVKWEDLFLAVQRIYDGKMARILQIGPGRLPYEKAAPLAIVSIFDEFQEAYVSTWADVV